MMLIAAVIMHFNAKHSLARQERRKAAQPKKKGASTPQQDMMETQMAMMQKLMVWVMPVLSLLGAFLWHVGLAVYMLTNTTWTFVQQVLVYRKMDREEEEEKQAKIEAKRTNAPVVGKKPKADGQGTKRSSTAVLEETDRQVSGSAKSDAEIADESDQPDVTQAAQSPAGPPLTADQVKSIRGEAASMTAEKLDETIAEIEAAIADPAGKKKAKKQKRLAVLRQFRAERSGGATSSAPESDS